MYQSPDTYETGGEFESQSQGANLNVSKGIGGQAHLDLSQIPTDMLMLKKPSQFWTEFCEKVKQDNPNATDMDIHSNVRVQEIQSGQSELRLITFITIGVSTLLWIIMAIIYGTMFKDFSNGFAKFLFISSFTVWIASNGAIGYSAKVFNTTYFKIIFLVVAGIFLFSMIGFFIVCTKVSGGYIFMLILCLVLLGIKEYAIFIIIKRMESLKERLQ